MRASITVSRISISLLTAAALSLLPRALHRRTHHAMGRRPDRDG